jgi:hypothetical protein
VSDLPEDPNVDLSSDKRIISLAIWLTAIWLIAITGYVLFFSPKLLMTLDPNEFGDFLSGASAPLAFLWLIAATLLQREELRAQRQEIVKNREEARRLADEASRQNKRAEKQFIDAMLHSRIDAFAVNIVQAAPKARLLGVRGSGVNLIPNNSEMPALRDSKNYPRLFDAIIANLSSVPDQVKGQSNYLKRPEDMIDLKALSDELGQICREAELHQDLTVHSRVKSLRLKDLVGLLVETAELCETIPK